MSDNPTIPSPSKPPRKNAQFIEHLRNYIAFYVLGLFLLVGVLFSLYSYRSTFLGEGQSQSSKGFATLPSVLTIKMKGKVVPFYVPEDRLQKFGGKKKDLEKLPKGIVDLSRIEHALEKAAKDDLIKAVSIELDAIHIKDTDMQSLCYALKKFKEDTDKKVYLYVENRMIDWLSFTLMAYADEVWVQKYAEFGLIDSIPQMLLRNKSAWIKKHNLKHYSFHRGKYKGCGAPFYDKESNTWKEWKKKNEEVLQDFYQAKKALIWEGIKKKGLFADENAFNAAFEELLKSRFKLKQLISQKEKKNPSWITGLVSNQEAYQKQLQEKYHHPSREVLGDQYGALPESCYLGEDLSNTFEPNEVACFEYDGDVVWTEDERGTGGFKGLLENMHTVVAKGCKKILLFLDTLGGDPYAVFRLADFSKEIREKGVDFMVFGKDFMGSAGAFVFGQGMHSVGYSTGVTGNIGVKSQYISLEGFLKKYGTDSVFFSPSVDGQQVDPVYIGGSLSGTLFTYKDLTEKQQKMIEENTKEFYDAFIKSMQEKAGKDEQGKERFVPEKHGDALYHMMEQAQAIGYVDEVVKDAQMKYVLKYFGVKWENLRFVPKAFSHSCHLLSGRCGTKGEGTSLLQEALECAPVDGQEPTYGFIRRIITL